MAILSDHLMNYWSLMIVSRSCSFKFIIRRPKYISHRIWFDLMIRWWKPDRIYQSMLWLWLHVLIHCWIERFFQWMRWGDDDDNDDDDDDDDGDIDADDDGDDHDDDNDGDDLRWFRWQWCIIWSCNDTVWTGYRIQDTLFPNFKRHRLIFRYSDTDDWSTFKSWNWNNFYVLINEWVLMGPIISRGPKKFWFHYFVFSV